MKAVYLTVAMTLAAIPASASDATLAACRQFVTERLAELPKLVASRPAAERERAEKVAAMFPPGRAVIVGLIEDFEVYFAHGFSVFDWAPCAGVDLATLGYTMTPAERETARRLQAETAKKSVPPKSTIPDEPLARAERRLEFKVGRNSHLGDRYALPGIICATAEDAVLQVQGASNASCRHWGGGWLSRWKWGAFRVSGGQIGPVNWVEMENGKTGYVPDVSGSGMSTIGCGEFLAARRHVPGGGSVDPHCVGHDGRVLR